MSQKCHVCVFLPPCACFYQNVCVFLPPCACFYQNVCVFLPPCVGDDTGMILAGRYRFAIEIAGYRYRQTETGFFYRFLHAGFAPVSAGICYRYRRFLGLGPILFIYFAVLRTFQLFFAVLGHVNDEIVRVRFACGKHHKSKILTNDRPFCSSITLR
jgi:hypothetical protein